MTSTVRSGWDHRLPLVFVVVALLLTLFLVQKVVNPPLYTWQPQASQTFGVPGNNFTVGQSFVGEYNDLTALDIKLAIEHFENNGWLIFHLRQAPDGKDLLTRRIAFADIKDNAYCRFDFSKIHRSAGGIFYFYLESQDTDTIKVWGYNRDVYNAGQAFLPEGSDDIRDLTFRVVYDPTLVGKIAWLVEQLGEDKPLLLGDSKLYVFFFIAYGVCLYLVLICFVRPFIVIGNGDKSRDSLDDERYNSQV